MLLLWSLLVLNIKLVGLTALRLLASVKRWTFREPNFLLIVIRLVTFEVRRLTWDLDVDKVQALNSRLLHLILKLASCNTCNHPCLKLLHAARALKENWFSFQKNESRKNKLQQLLQAVDWHAHRLFQKLKTVQSSIITMIKIMIPILKRYCIMHLSAASPVEGDPREPPVICTTTFTNPSYPKPRLFNKKLLTPLPWGAKKCALPSQ